MTKSIFELKLRAAEPLAKRLLDLVLAAGDTDDQLRLLWRCASAIAFALDEDEVQSHLCDLYLSIEVAAGRASFDEHSAWVTPTLRSWLEPSGDE